MSISLTIWIGLFFSLSILSFIHRPVWSIILYLMVFFLHPYYWWWGRNLRGSDLRWSFFAGVVCILVFLYYRYLKGNILFGSQIKPFLKTNIINALLVGLVVNYCFVHFFLVSVSFISFPLFNLGLKFILLFVLMRYAIQSTDDLLYILLSIILFLGYLGYQVKMNGVGQMVGGRIEMLPLPSADNSNFTASILVLFLPSMGAFFFVVKKMWQKIIALCCLPFIVNLLFLCSSRSAWLGIITSGLFLAFKTKKKEWKILSVAIVFSVVAVIGLAGDERIFERFATIFIENEDRDNSASSRFLFWQAGLEVINDYPLGSGGNAFKSVHSINYLPKYGIERYRAIHNSYLGYTINWGVQGIIMLLLLFLFVLKPCLSASEYLISYTGLYKESFLGKTLVAGFLGFMVDGVFSNTIDDEWCFWMLSMMYAYTKLVQKERFIIG